MSITAMKMALEALKYMNVTAEHRVDNRIPESAITSLRQAIAEAEKQEQGEPVAWWIPKAEQFCLPNANNERPFAKAWEPLYATPQPAQKPLTDEQIEEIFGIHNDEDERYALHYERDLVRQIEAAHGIKE